MRPYSLICRTKFVLLHLGKKIPYAMKTMQQFFFRMQGLGPQPPAKKFSRHEFFFHHPRAIGVPSRGLVRSTSDMTMSALDWLHAITVATLLVVKQLEATSLDITTPGCSYNLSFFGRCASCTGDSSKGVTCSLVADSGFRRLGSPGGGRGREMVLAMHTGAPHAHAPWQRLWSPLGHL